MLGELEEVSGVASAEPRQGSLRRGLCLLLQRRRQVPQLPDPQPEPMPLASTTTSSMRFSELYAAHVTNFDEDINVPSTTTWSDATPHASTTASTVDLLNCQV